MTHTTECPANYDRCTCGKTTASEHRDGCFLYSPEAVCTCGGWEADMERIAKEDADRIAAWKAQVKDLNKPTSRFSVYDDPAHLPGDPLPVEGEPLTPMQLAHHRIEHDISLARDLHVQDSTAWRTTFNNLAGNVRGLLNAFDAQLKKEMGERLVLAARLKKLEKRVR